MFICANNKLIIAKKKAKFMENDPQKNLVENEAQYFHTTVPMPELATKIKNKKRMIFIAIGAFIAFTIIISIILFKMINPTKTNQDQLGVAVNSSNKNSNSTNNETFDSKFDRLCDLVKAEYGAGVECDDSQLWEQINRISGPESEWPPYRYRSVTYDVEDNYFIEIKMIEDPLDGVAYFRDNFTCDKYDQVSSNCIVEEIKPNIFFMIGAMYRTGEANNVRSQETTNKINQISSEIKQLLKKY